MVILFFYRVIHLYYVKRVAVNRKDVRIIIFGISMGMLIFFAKFSDNGKQAYRGHLLPKKILISPKPY
jgi:hypothetical protein